MADISSVFHWGSNSKVFPCLVAAANYHGKHVPSVNSCLQEHWVLDYSFEEHGLCRVGNTRARWIPRKSRIAHLYPAQTRYWEDTRTAAGKRHSAWLLFDHGREAGLGDLIRPGQKYARFSDPDGIIGDFIVKIAEIGAAQGGPGFWEAQAVFCRVIGALIGAEHIDKEDNRIRGTDKPQVSDFVDQVNGILKQHQTGRLSLAALARELSMSPSAVSHRYRREAGIPPMTALQHMRIETAKAFLLRGFPLKTIADELGFSDEFHLSKAFKRVTGLAPRNWRSNR